MKKLNTSKDIILLIELFIDNALRGLLKHSILSKKSTRIVIGVCVFFIYFAYFFFNMSELARIVPDSEKISHILIEQGRKITFYSYFRVKSRLLCKMLYNVFTISTYQN